MGTWGRTIAGGWLLASLSLLGCGGGTVDDGGTACGTDEGCDDGVFCNGVERCDPAADEADARGCVAAAAGPCGAGTTCDEAARSCTCDGVADADGDGHDAFDCGGDDCDDEDPNRYPGNAEVCDTADHDEDCDPSTYGVRDSDGDGYPDRECCNDVVCGNDCDDASAAVHPSEAESCDGLDNDCDGRTDEGAEETFYRDGDGDDFGTDGDTVQGCSAPSGYADRGGDCDDANGGVNPGVPEVCTNLIDDNCAGGANEGCACAVSDPPRDCGPSDPTEEVCVLGTQTCRADGTWGPCEGLVVSRPEVCDATGISEDCDTLVNEDDAGRDHGLECTGMLPPSTMTVCDVCGGSTIREDPSVVHPKIIPNDGDWSCARSSTCEAPQCVLRSTGALAVVVDPNVLWAPWSSCGSQVYSGSIYAYTECTGSSASECLCGWVEWPLPAEGRYRLVGTVAGQFLGCRWELRDFDTGAVLQSGTVPSSSSATVTHDFGTLPSDPSRPCPLSPRVAFYSLRSSGCRFSGWTLERIP